MTVLLFTVTIAGEDSGTNLDKILEGFHNSNVPGYEDFGNKEGDVDSTTEVGATKEDKDATDQKDDAIGSDVNNTNEAPKNTEADTSKNTEADTPKNINEVSKEAEGVNMGHVQSFYKVNQVMGHVQYFYKSYISIGFLVGVAVGSVRFFCVKTYLSRQAAS